MLFLAKKIISMKNFSQVLGPICHESGCPSTTWTLALHSLLHSTSDYISHHSLHRPHTHTHTQLIAVITQLSPITRSPESHHTHHTKDIHFLFLPAKYCFACSILLMLETYQAFACLCSVSCIVLCFSLSQCQLLYGAPPRFLCLILV